MFYEHSSTAIDELPPGLIRELEQGLNDPHSSVADEHSPFAAPRQLGNSAARQLADSAAEGESEAGVAASGIERAMLAGLITFGQRDANWLTDQVFFTRHPDLRGKKLRPDQRDLVQEWSTILHDLVQPALSVHQTPTAPPKATPGTTTGGRPASGKKAYALQIADHTPVPDQPGVTIRQLIEQWRPGICPEVPIEVLLAFLAYEPGKALFRDATHGTLNNHWTSPEFYELGLFQTPAGLHGVCTTGDWSSCAHGPPGVETHSQSPWSKLCQDIGANPDDWTNPTTQVRVGLANLEEGAHSTRSAFPDLFPTAGSDWDLRMAVLYGFAQGPGAAQFFLGHFRKELAALPEAARWDFLRDKSLTARGHTKPTPFSPRNVEEKMALAAELGYVPKPDAPALTHEAFESFARADNEGEILEAGYDSAAAELPGYAGESYEFDSASNEAASVDPASNEYRASYGLPELEFDVAADGIAAGKRDMNSLTDFVFYSRHPELHGTKIQAGQTALTAEWQQIRDTIAAPALAKLNDSAPAPAPTGAPSGDPDAVVVYDGSSPAPGTVETRRSFATSPPITSDRSNRSATRYANVINQFAVGVNSRYKVRTDPQTHAVSTYCNIFCWDVTRAMGVEVPHWVNAKGDPTSPGVGNELNANSVYDWLHHHGSRYGWRQIATQEEAQQLANAGHPVIVAMKKPGGIGHVAVIRPGELNAQGAAMAQAGASNYNNTRVYGVFRRSAPVEFWAND